MKLETLSQILNEMPPPPRNATAGSLSSNYGMILNNVSDSRIDYDEVGDIKVFTDKAASDKSIAKLFASYTGDPDDVFLHSEERYDHQKWSQFCEECWIFDRFN